MSEDFEIIVLNGITGDCLTTADDAMQRLKENPPDPLEDIRQEHETWLAQLEGLAVEAIATNNWDELYAHILDFQNLVAIAPLQACLTVRHEALGSEGSTKSLGGSGADLLPTTEQ